MNRILYRSIVISLAVLAFISGTLVANSLLDSDAESDELLQLED